VRTNREKVDGKPGLNSPNYTNGSVFTTIGAKTKTMKGIIGKKIGMTSIFGTDGKQTACTIIEAGPLRCNPG
jgi:hypothetical protein